MSDSPRADSKRTFVNYDEIPQRPPPLLSVGPLAWIRKNLFSSLLDTILTLLSVTVVVGVIAGLAQWSINQANWFVITFNTRQFMLGRYETQAEWRVHLTALVVIFVMGAAIAAFSRMKGRFFVVLVAVVAIMYALPVLITSTLSLPSNYLTAANMSIQSGSVTQEAQPRLSFLGKAGEVITIELAEDLGASEEALSNQYGFMDKATNNLRNNAANRLAAIERKAELEALLAGDLLTASQRDQYTTELERLAVPEENVLDTYQLNQLPTQVRVLQGTTMEPLAEAVLEYGSEALKVTLPEDGWYVLEKSIDGDTQGASILDVHGLYPILARSFTISASTGPDGETIPARRVNQYIRMTDNFLTEDPLPRVDDTELPFALIIDNQYWGTRPVTDYLRVYLAPFLDQLDPALAQFVLLLAAGYFAAKLADRFFSPKDKPRQMSNRMATWLLIVLPFFSFIVIYGIGDILKITDTRNWGGLLLTMMLTMVGIIGAFPLGVLLALGRRSELPVVRIVSTLYIEFVRGVPLITVLFMAQLLVPFLNPALADVDSVFRAMIAVTMFSAAYLAENVRGGLQSVPDGQVEAARALGLSGLQITLQITLPQALRAVIPALVGQFISLFKDTSLVAIVGLIDLTGISNSVIAQTEFIGLRREAYVFITIIYFIFSYVMSWVSRRIERTGSGAVRRG